MEAINKFEDTVGNDSCSSSYKQNLDDADLVGNVKGVVVGGQLDVGLLGAIGTDQGVHLK